MKRSGWTVVSNKLKWHYLNWLFFSFVYATSYSQDKPTTPKNYIGIMSGAEWKTFSINWGINYMRILYSAQNITLGGQAYIIPKYTYGNARLGLERSGSDLKGSAMYLLFLGTADYYTARNGGFILHAGIGPGTKFFRNEAAGPNANQLEKTTSITGAFELGIGVQIPMSSQALRFDLTNTWGAFTGSYTSLRMAISF